MATEQKTYDIKEFSEKAITALKKMEQQQQPGQASKGGKKDVILAVKDELKAMMDKGYTAQQIAEAFKQDVFGILPKTITEIVDGRRNTVKRTKKREDNKIVHTSPNDKATKQKANRPDNKAGSFTVKPDKEDI